MEFHCEDSNGSWSSVSGMEAGDALSSASIRCEKRECLTAKPRLDTLEEGSIHAERSCRTPATGTRMFGLTKPNIPHHFLLLSGNKKKKGSSQRHFGNWEWKGQTDEDVNFISYFSASNFIWQKPAREKSLVLMDSAFDWFDLKPCKQIFNNLLFSLFFAKTFGLFRKTLFPQKTKPDCDY